MIKFVYNFDKAYSVVGSELVAGNPSRGFGKGLGYESIHTASNIECLSLISKDDFDHPDFNKYGYHINRSTGQYYVDTKKLRGVHPLDMEIINRAIKKMEDIINRDNKIDDLLNEDTSVNKKFTNILKKVKVLFR
jgi:hypothetical protein